MEKMFELQSPVVHGVEWNKFCSSARSLSAGGLCPTLMQPSSAGGAPLRLPFAVNICLYACQAITMIGYAFALVPLYFFVYLPLWQMLYGTTSKPSELGVTDININYSAIASDEPLSCLPHSYNTHILSQDPLIVYIENFLSTDESTHLLKIR